jgi:uncharacterized protein (TIGR02246 family)
MNIRRDEAEAWLTRYGQAWMQADPELAAVLFTDDCRYFETPYSEPAVGRAGVRRYWQAVPDGQRDVRFDYRVLAVDGETVIAHWTASFVRAATGVRVALDGVFLLEFAAGALCRTLREWWHRSETGPAA